MPHCPGQHWWKTKEWIEWNGMEWGRNGMEWMTESDEDLKEDWEHQWIDFSYQWQFTITNTWMDFLSLQQHFTYAFHPMYIDHRVSWASWKDKEVLAFYEEKQELMPFPKSTMKRWTTPNEPIWNQCTNKRGKSAGFCRVQKFFKKTLALPTLLSLI